MTPLRLPDGVARPCDRTRPQQPYVHPRMNPARTVHHEHPTGPVGPQGTRIGAADHPKCNDDPTEEKAQGAHAAGCYARHARRHVAQGELQVNSTHRALEHRARAVVALVVLVLAAAGLVACGSSGGGSSDARALLRQTFSGTHKIKSGKAAVNLTIDAQGDPSLQQPIKLTVTGPFQSTGKSQIPQFDLTLNVAAQGQTIQAGLTSTSDRVFVQVMGQAYEVPASLLAQIRKNMQQSQQSSHKGGLSLGGIGIDPMNWLSDPKVVGTETLNGTETKHITASLNVDALLNDLDKLLAKLKAQGGIPGAGAAQIPSRIPGKARSEIKDAIKSSSVDVWTGASDTILRKLSIALAIQPKNPGSGLKSANVSLSVELSDLNKPQTVTAPSSAKPLGDLLSQLGGLLGAGFGSSLGGSSGGGSAASSVQIQKYSQCLQTAGSDVAKAQQCAALLRK
jgi:hypothetical protein